jgi:GT2 family glycosyltransferase
MALPSLSIIIPTYNGRHFLGPCLRSVYAHAPPATQVIVADDASTDDTIHWLKAHYPDVELVQLAENQGFCRVVNAGLTRAQGDVVELLNNDTEVFAGWAAACLKHFADPSVGSVAPVVTRLDDPGIIDSLGQEFHICGWAYNRGYGRRLDMADLAVREVFGAAGSCGFYRRAALEKLGGLWPIYGFYFEDTDLAFRLRWAGYRTVLEPAARVGHVGSATTEEHLSSRKVWLLSRNEEIVFWANLPKRELLLAVIPHLGFFVVRAVKKLLKGQLTAFLSGKLAALRQFPSILQRRKETQALAQTSARPISLWLSRNAAILLQGIRWLRRRTV